MGYSSFEGVSVRIAKEDIRKWARGGLLGMATAVSFVIPAAADDDEICAKASGDIAIDACTRALKSGRYGNRGLSIIYSNRGNRWSRKGEHDKAMEDHNEAIRIDSTYPAGFMNRGNAYARHGEFDRGIADLTEAIRLDPKTPLPFITEATPIIAKVTMSGRSRITLQESN